MKLSLWWSGVRHYRIPVVILVFSAAVLWWGWHFGGTDGVPFSRSGALVTALSIVFLFWRYPQILAAGVDTAREYMERRLEWMNLKPSVAKESLARTVRKVDDARARIERNITYVQGVILLIGTLVWGFGDLIYQYRALPCSIKLWKLLHFGGY